MPRRRRQPPEMATPNMLPVVLLHGCGGSVGATYEATGWIEQLTGAGRSSVAVTLPGHGADALHDPAAYCDLAGSVLATLPPRFDAVGFSLGGKLLLEIAARAPERVGRLVIGGVGDNLFAPERSGETSATALESGIDDDTGPAALSFYHYCATSGANMGGVAAVLRRPPNPVFEVARLSGIAAPILLVIGDADPIAVPAVALTAALPDAKVVSLPGVDHLSLPANSDFIRHSLDFLAAS